MNCRNGVKTFIMSIVLLTIFTYRVRSIKWGNWDFGRCPFKASKFRVFQGLTIQKCVMQCALRQKCVLIAYSRKFSLCELHYQPCQITIITMEDPHCVQINMTTVDVSEIANGCKCQNFETCDLETNACQPQECLPQTLAQGLRVARGNMNNVNSKKTVQCDNTYNQTVCSNTGEWNLNCPATNVALQKPAEQSSNYNGDGVWLVAGAGVDGTINQNYTDIGASTFFHTTEQPNPWWRVDLQNSYIITKIVLYNRSDNNMGERSHDIEIKFGFTESDLTLVHFIPGVLPLIYDKLFCEEYSARYVQVSIRSTSDAVDFLHLVEVQVYGFQELS